MPTTFTPDDLRSEAVPDRSRDRRRLRSDVGAGPRDHQRLPGRPPEVPGQRPGSLPRILGGLHILVVDDDRDILDLFATALTACGGQVTCADNASDALALAIRARPHVIVSDIAMVGEDGYWLIARLRQLPGDMRPDVPVLAATAYGREHSRARVLAAGFTEHVQKPVDPEMLCRVVAKLAGR